MRAVDIRYHPSSETERHTAKNIEKWTKQALEAIGLTEDKLLAAE